MSVNNLWYAGVTDSWKEALTSKTQKEMQKSLKYELIPSFQSFGSYSADQMLTLIITSDWDLPMMASAFFTHLICSDTALQNSSNYIFFKRNQNFQSPMTAINGNHFPHQQGMNYPNIHCKSK